MTGTAFAMFFFVHGRAVFVCSKVQWIIAKILLRIYSGLLREDRYYMNIK